MNTNSLCKLAVETALEAGELLAHGFGTGFSISSKAEGRQNLVTEYDKASEALIIEKIKKAVPSSSFLAEESGVTDKANASVLWIIDPLDGTVNFAHNLPFFAVSIAAAVDGEVVAGVVYQPLLRELFVAEKGKGSTLNGKLLSINHNTSQDNAILTTGFPYNVEENPMKCLDTAFRAFRTGIPIRRFGSAALDLSYTAAGRFDAFWEVDLQPWDMAAGMLIVQEAGGIVTDYFNKPIDPCKRGSLIAGNSTFHSFMLNLIQHDANS